MIYKITRYVALWLSLAVGQKTVSCHLATSSENLVASAQFLVAMETSESQFQALKVHSNILLKPTFLCLISSFFFSKNVEGMPPIFSCALTSRLHNSFINSRAFFDWRKPVILICMDLGSGLYTGKDNQCTDQCTKNHVCHSHLSNKICNYVAET